jgi:hypothetical protein
MSSWPSYSPEELWSTGTALAVLDAAVPENGMYALEKDGTLAYSDGGSAWWSLAWFGEGRAVLCGRDVDFSETSGDTVDLLAGCPAWLPTAWATAREARSTAGFLYWSNEGGWDRSPGIDDEVDTGVGCLGGSCGLESQVYEDIAVRLSGAGMSKAAEAAAYAAADALEERAAKRTVDAAVLEALFAALPNGGSADVAAALSLAERAGLTEGSTVPHLPANPS